MSHIDIRFKIVELLINQGNSNPEFLIEKTEKLFKFITTGSSEADSESK